MKPFRCAVSLAVILVLVLALAPAGLVLSEPGEDAPQDVTYPLYVAPGFSARHFRTLASRKGFPPSVVPLPRPPGATEVIALCPISEYETAGRSEKLAWRCRWQEDPADPDTVNFELTAYYDNRGWVEATAILLDAAYFELVPGIAVGESDELAGAVDLALASGESVTIRRTAGDDTIPIITVDAYETGEDADFQFYVTGDEAGKNEATFDLMAEGGNENSRIEGHISLLRPRVPGVAWSLFMTRAADGDKYDFPAEEPLRLERDTHNALAFSSLVSYFTGGDGDFSVRSFANISEDRLWFQVSAAGGNDDGWAGWQQVLIQIPK